MYTDGWFLNGADEAVQYYLKYSDKPIYYYLFGHRGPSSFTEIFGDKEKDYGVCHADELQYLFPLAESLFPDKPQTPQDKKIAEIMTTLWVNFALTGYVTRGTHTSLSWYFFRDPTPTTSDLLPSKWTPVTGDNLEYFHISSDGASMHKGLFKKRAEFWRNLPIRTSNEIKDEL